MSRRVRGLFFADYVKMVRSRKDIDWSIHLRSTDMPHIMSKIDPGGWYPMETFERLGVAILKEIARGQLDGVRMWGRFQVDMTRAVFPHLIAEGDPRDTMMRFGVLAKSFFDYDALVVENVLDQTARVVIQYGMGPVAEETACHQSLGFFERLVEMAGAESPDARFTARSWLGPPKTIIEIAW